MKLRFKLVKANGVYEIRLGTGRWVEDRKTLKGAMNKLEDLMYGGCTYKTFQTENLNKEEIQYLKDNCIYKLRA